MPDLSAARWRKSSHSGSQGGDCVEVAPLEGGEVAVRHSHRPDDAVIVYSAAEWQAFTAGVRDGEFDFD